MNIFLITILLQPLFSSPYSDFVDALYYENKREYDKAYEIIERLNDKYKDEFLQKYLYDLALKGYRLNQIKIDKLEESIKKIIAIDSTTVNGWLLYASIKATEGNTEEAKNAYKKVIELDPNNIDAYYQLALLSTNNTEEALYYFNKIKEINPELSSDVYYNIAVLYSIKKNEKKVIEYINKAIKEDPQSIKPYYFMSLWWEEKGDFNKAIEWYKKSLQIEPTNTEITNRIAELYISTKNYTLAEEYFMKTLKINPSDSKALWYLAILMEMRNDFASARDYLSKIINWQNDLDVVLKMSYYTIMLGDIKKAVNILEDAYKKWQGNIELAYYLGLGMMDMGKNNEARKYFEIVVSSKPDNYEARYNLGVICERLNDVDCFKRNFGYIIMKKPDDANVLNYLGYSLIDRDIVDEDVIVDSITLLSPFEMVKKAISIEPNNYAFLDSLAWAYYKKGDCKNAFTYIEKSLSLSNSIDPIILEHRADILSCLGDYDEAYRDYIKAYIYDKDERKDKINKSASMIYKKISPTTAVDEFKRYVSNNFHISGNLKIKLIYRKLLSRKEVNFTLAFWIKNEPVRKTFELNILGPLFLPVLDLKISNGEFDIKGSMPNDRITSDKIKKSFKLLWLYFNYDEYIGKFGFSVDDNGYFYWKDILEKGDNLILKNKKNYLFFDTVEYSYGNYKISIIFDEFKSQKNDVGNITVVPNKITIYSDKYTIELNSKINYQDE